ncbi:YpmS family protein [Bacillus sp. 1NLA3E]|uniref:YpmS family protein n=1 Tax=Bacillus sp. 1NLA3E TaxID=666686 RepID=UPI0002DB3ECB|nr:YpmS family protein [Bacillus sp. 1NLA3E]AGK54570.1 hypothetical protein B1NLA3E_14120 [Bacillus sp. 1NLA3E]
MKGKWKKLFFILAGFNILAIAIIYILISLPSNDHPVKNKGFSSESVPFKIQTNKQDLNRVINHYLQEQDKGPIEYQVSLDKYVNLYGEFPIFNQDVEMKVSFEPKALKNGDLILKEKAISVGRLRLPASYVLNFVNERYHFPEWVTILPNDEMIYVNLQKMKLKSDLKVKVNEFDLEKDQIKFTLLVPMDKGVSK